MNHPARSLHTILRFAGAALLLAGVALTGTVRPAAAGPSITATPSTVVVPQNASTASTTIAWDAGAVAGFKQIKVSANGGAESVLLNTPQATGATPLTVTYGSSYVVRLYGAGQAAPLASTTVTTVRLSLPGIDPTVSLPPAKPDLTVAYLGPDPLGNLKFRVSNAGSANAGGFRVAILAGANSYGFDRAGLTKGASTDHVIPAGTVGCGQSFVIWVDPTHKVDEQNESNNTAAPTAPCLIDGGVNKIPVDD
jgi:hypothetical protein